MKKFKSSVTSKLTKVTSIILVVAMMTVTLAGCGGQTAQKDNRLTTEEFTTASEAVIDVDEPTTEIDPGVDVTETTTEEPTTEEPTTEATTEAPGDNSGVDNGDGTWSYTVYGDIVVTLPVCFDDYIKIHPAGFYGVRFEDLAKEFGWTLPNEEDEYNYTYDGGDYLIRFNFSYYSDEKIPLQEVDSYQIKSCDYSFYKADSPTEFYYNELLDNSKKNVVIDYGKKPGKIDYIILPSAAVSLSRDDAILLVYLITAERKYPGRNPFYYLGNINDRLDEGGSYTVSYFFE